MVEDLEGVERPGGEPVGEHRQHGGEGVTALTREIMTLQAEGSYAKAKQMSDTLGVLRPQAKAVLDKLTSVPVDIEPRFVTALEITNNRYF